VYGWSKVETERPPFRSAFATVSLVHRFPAHQRLGRHGIFVTAGQGCGVAIRQGFFLHPARPTPQSSSYGICGQRSTGQMIDLHGGGRPQLSAGPWVFLPLVILRGEFMRMGEWLFQRSLRMPPSGNLLRLGAVGRAVVLMGDLKITS